MENNDSIYGLMKHFKFYCINPVHGKNYPELQIKNMGVNKAPFLNCPGFETDEHCHNRISFYDFEKILNKVYEMAKDDVFNNERNFYKGKVFNFHIYKIKILDAPSDPEGLMFLDDNEFIKIGILKKDMDKK